MKFEIWKSLTVKEVVIDSLDSIAIRKISMLTFKAQQEALLA